MGKGPRGTLVKSFKHLAVDIYMTDKTTIKVEKWFGKKKQIAAVRSVCSHIKNMFKGLTLGYQYKMSAVYAHFPINCAITEGGTLIEVRNFLGEKFIRKVRMHPGVTVENSKNQKDELIVQGTPWTWCPSRRPSSNSAPPSRTRTSGSSLTGCSSRRRPLSSRRRPRDDRTFLFRSLNVPD